MPDDLSFRRHPAATLPAAFTPARHTPRKEGWLSRLARAAARGLRAWRAGRRAERELAAMDARLLRDIGFEPDNPPPGLRTVRRRRAGQRA